MKAISVALLLGLTAICARCAVLQLPVPPEQQRQWHPDPATPTNIVSAADKLFEQGFPDPRGCEYREIDVEVSGVWDGEGILVKTHGWVLPQKTGTNRFAICWNGLIYPVAKVGAPADLHAEVSKPNSLMGRRFGFNGDSAVGESASVNYSNALTTRILLLLRCGETAAALTNWSPNQRMTTGRFASSGVPTQINDPYLEFAGDWAWAMFDGMVSAHQRGDEALALATARQLAKAQPEMEVECARRGFPRQQYLADSRRGEQRPYLDFLDQLPQMLADLEGRAKEPANTNVIEAGLSNFPLQAMRIAALVDNLSLVSARQ